MSARTLIVAGAEYARAADLAAMLGVAPDTVRTWARRGYLASYRLPGSGRGQAWYAVAAATEIEREKRASGRGRPRQLDTAATGSDHLTVSV